MKMYKQKFKIWKWSKKLPRNKAEWMLARARKRENPASGDPKDTTFDWGNQIWTVDRVKQSLGRRNEVEDLAPQGKAFTCTTKQGITRNRWAYTERYRGQDADLHCRITSSYFFSSLFSAIWSSLDTDNPTSQYRISSIAVEQP
jgi:hypothetical protein